MKARLYLMAAMLSLTICAFARNDQEWLNASEELFFSDKPGISSSDVFDATRSQVGLNFHPVPSNDALACNLYFMVLHSISDGAQDWSPLNIFGFEVAYAF